MTGQDRDLDERGGKPDEAAGATARKPASGVGPSTRELLHLLNAIQGKASA